MLVALLAAMSVACLVLTEVIEYQAEKRRAQRDAECRERIDTTIRIIGHFERRSLGNLHHARDKRVQTRSRHQ